MTEDFAPHSLDIRQLRKAYKGRTVVHEVSMQLNSGEVVGLLGPNGAGKTTSFYMIVGLVKSDAGEIWMDNKNLARMPIHQRARMGLSYLPQEASVFRKLSVADNIRAILQLQTDTDDKPLSDDLIETRLTELLNDLQISPLRDNMAVSLSGVSGGALKSLGRLRHHLGLFCLTSPLPVSIRSPSSRSNELSGF